MGQFLNGSTFGRIETTRSQPGTQIDLYWVITTRHRIYQRLLLLFKHNFLHTEQNIILYINTKIIQKVMTANMLVIWNDNAANM
ncbi:hypothetical protein C0J52_11068 [Blattella germanica]|nr:hypothetical protein C0J52_11068 [Blattella germanica]